MNWPEFEKDMKNMVGGHETPIDTDVLWDKIQEKRRKRRGLLWFWGGGVALLLGGLWWWHVNSGVRGTEISAVVQEVGVGEKPRNQSRESDRIEADNQVQTQHREGIQRQDEVQYLAQKQGREEVGIQEESQLRSQDQIQKQVKSPIQNQLQTPKQGQLTAQMPVSAGELSATIFKGENPNSVKTPNIGLSLPASFEAEIVVLKSETLSALAPLPVLWQLLALPEQTLVLPGKSLALTPENSAKKAKNNRLSPAIACNTGYYKWNSVGAIPDPFSQSRNLETVQGSIHLMLPLSTHWTVQTGLSFARTTSRITWVRTWEEEKTIYPKNYYANGAIELDTAHVTYLMRREINHYNHWTQIGLPLGMEYRFSFGKAYLTPQLGLQLNYLLPAQGLANDANHNLSADVFAAHFQRKFLLQGQAGFEFGYHLSEKWSIAAGPHVQFDFTPRTTAGVSHPERFFMYGVQLGLRRNLIFD
jgi:hypothetical protein